MAQSVVMSAGVSGSTRFLVDCRTAGQSCAKNAPFALPNLESKSFLCGQNAALRNKATLKQGVNARTREATLKGRRQVVRATAAVKEPAVGETAGVVENGRDKERVMIIGEDCPGLPCISHFEGLRQLARHKVGGGKPP